MTIPVIDLGGWAPVEDDMYTFWIQEGVGNWVTDPDTGQTTWQFQGIYAGNMTYTHSWGGVILTGNKHPNGPSTDPENPTYVEGWHTNIRMYGQPLLEAVTEGLEQYEVIGQDPDTGEDILGVKEVWDRSHLAGSAWWDLNQFPQGIPGLGYPPGWGRPPGLDGVMFSDIRRFTSQSNRWQ